MRQLGHQCINNTRTITYTMLNNQCTYQFSEVSLANADSEHFFTDQMIFQKNENILAAFLLTVCEFS